MKFQNHLWFIKMKDIQFLEDNKFIINLLKIINLYNGKQKIYKKTTD